MSSPSKPVNITSFKPGSVEHSFTGTPDLRALRAHYATASTPPPNIPLRSTTPAIGTPRNTTTPQRSVTPNIGTPRNPPSLLPSLDSSPINKIGPAAIGGISARRPTTPLDIDNLPDEEKAKVLRRHLVSKEDRKGGSNEDVPNPSVTFDGDNGRVEDSEPFPVPYTAPGADVTHDIYKWHADQQRQAARVRSVSFAGPSPPMDPAFEHIHEPGGFRRNYVLLKANEQGTQEPPKMLNNFIDFLFIFGHFAGEDLEEDDDDEREDEEQTTGFPSTSSLETQTGLSGELNERQPLLRKSRSRSRRRRNSINHTGDATVTQAVLMLLKGFVGTGVLFLGKAFFNGGLLFSAVTLTFICLISLYSFLLLVKAKVEVPGSFGDIGGTLYGPWMRYAILTSITISQIGFVATYTIFVAENLQAFVLAVTKCIHLIGLQYFILIQMIIFLPLSLIRNLAKLSTTALIADVFILAGLIYIFGSEMKIIGKSGVADVKMFNSKDFPLFIGTAVFSFEGIGLVIPIADSMREPRKFPAALSGVMISLLVIFGGAGALSYLAFGSEIQTVVIVNLDSTSKLTQAVQFIYALAILLSVPLQLFPAVRIMENGIFERSGKSNTRVKWTKNLFRCAVVVFCAIVSYVGAADLDKFVALIGSFACVPLCLLYPAMLHYKACAKTRKQKIADITLGLFGIVASVYTTVQTIMLMAAPQGPKSPYGSCDTP